MKVLKVDRAITFYVDTDMDDFGGSFRRGASGGFEQLIGDSWETVYSLEDELETAFNDFMITNALKTQAPAQPAGQDRIDAERYRWLRSVGVWLDPSKFAKATRVLDAAIDASMKGESK